MYPLDTQPLGYFPNLFSGGVSPEILRQEIDLTDLEADELEEVSIIVTNFFCQELLNEVGGKVVVVPSYVIPKRGAKPYKKLVSFNYVGDFHFVENWLKLELSDQLIVAFEYIPFNVVFDLPIGFASASVLLPDQTRMEFIVKCQYSRAVSERDPSKRDGVLVLEFSFPTGYFEEEPLSEFEKVIKPIELDDSVSPLV